MNDPRPRPWIDAEESRLPDLDPSIHELLDRDIRKRGVLVPVFVDRDGNVIDGLVRMRIAEKYGLAVQKIQIPGRMTVAERADIRLALNTLRRHLTREQMREIIAWEVRRHPEASDRGIAGQLGVDHKTVGSVRRGLEAGGEIPHLAVRIGDDGKSYRQPNLSASLDSIGESGRVSNSYDHESPTQTRRAGDSIGERYRLIEGDCMEVMRDLGPADMILADLPFGLTNAPWDCPLDLRLFWERLGQVAGPKTPIVLFSAQPFTTDLISSNRKLFRYLWYWHKGKASNFLNAVHQPMRMIEEICVFYGRKGVYNPQMKPLEKPTRRKLYANASEMLGKLADQDGLDHRYGGYREDTHNYPRDLLHFKAVPRKGRLHSAQKPVPLLEYLIMTHSNEGDTVLDCCMGSSSTGEACLNLGRRFVGIEKDRDTFQIASERMLDVAETRV